MYVTLVPAYGRDYKSKKSVMEDFNAHKDFVICCVGHPYDGKYINKNDIDNDTSNVKYTIRYNQQTKVMNL